MKFPGGGGGLGGMLAQAQKMQAEMKTLQDKLALREIQVESAGGRIKITITGKQEIKNLVLAKEIIDADDPAMLADMIKVAVNHAVEESQKMVAQEMGKVIPPGLAGMLG
jgi:DNA-binding YbaB/EbfC family protein